MGIKLSLFISFFIFVYSSAASQTPTALSNLQFGDQIFPGISKTVTPDEAGASEFKITGEGSAEVQVIFYLPSDLVDASNNQLSITFSSDSGRYSTDELIGSSTAFDPKGGFTATLSLTGELYIWVGGTVHPTTFQPGNTYSGDITLDVSYTTN